MKKLLWIVPALALVACQTEEKQNGEVEIEAPEEETSAEDPMEEGEPEEENPEEAFNVSNVDTLVGHPFDKVEPALKAAEIKYRVVERDGEPFPVTMDFLPDRLNFKIKDGVITAVTKG